MISLFALGGLLSVAFLGYAFDLFSGTDEDNDDDTVEVPESLSMDVGPDPDPGPVGPIFPELGTGDDDDDDSGDDDESDEGDDDEGEDTDDESDEGDDTDDEGEDTGTIRRIDGAIVSGTGTSASDVLIVGSGETATGGAGADTFFIADVFAESVDPSAEDVEPTYTPANGATITDFESGTDRIVLTSFPDLEEGSPERLDVLDWDIREDGVALTRQPDGGETVDLVFLEGETEIPPLEDIGQRITTGEDPSPDLNIDGLPGLFPAVGGNFVLRFDGTDGADTVDFDAGTTGGFTGDLDRVAEIDTGGGGDIVSFAGVRIDADLGSGDDSYVGRTAILPGETDPQENIAGGDGDDTIAAGASVLDIRGGAGNDLLSARDAISGQIDGGSGDDDIGVSRSAEAVVAGAGDPLTLFGGAGADDFTVIVDRDISVGYEAPVIADFDQTEDTLVVFLDDGYPGSGVISLVQRSGGGGTAVELDGTVLVEIATELTDPDVIAVAIT